MPVMDGFDAARRIKHEFPSTLILVVSQFDSARFARKAIAAGDSGYVVKIRDQTIPTVQRRSSSVLLAP
jgi:YesN/AraC family two-component response regulator